ncbi:sugar ABC transporter ATP-binding protein [Cohnella herbarum]|uniref:Sugar ABC transporter ATP-binding protein n=1 Tax=Cohnella herbarum TaxID=2728023 RepID=A0A7Z2ZLI8_9BACL|nr:sugar ABC transporter ATP-binding protein [Cohnella herbarum]QJD83944.1 sugar ABC transporter ATP-binding protein [Cohnella herbarum]
MLLQMKGISKSFYGVQVLDNIDFELLPGEVHALVGENGAGKSTLAKLMSGVHRPDDGYMIVNGKPVPIFSTIEAQRMGISMIYQESCLVPEMSIAENVFLGSEPRWLGLFSNMIKMKRETKSILRSLGMPLHPNTKIKNLSISEHHVVAIAKALSLKANIFVMDEPTASLSDSERIRLFDMIRRFKTEGVGIVYITHRLNEIFEICDRVTVLRDGKKVLTSDVSELSEKDLVKTMVGRELAQIFPPLSNPTGNELLRVENLTRKPWFEKIAFKLDEGEILGITGLVGSGTEGLAKTIFGEVKPETGKVFWHKQRIQLKTPQQAINSGFGYVNRDRIESGLFMDMNVFHNLTIASLKKIHRYHLVQNQHEHDKALDAIIQLDIKTRDPEQEIKFLSGGNQQKVMLGKWLVAESDLYILDEPTRGIDVASKSELYVLLHELVSEGKGMIVISSDMSELIGLCNRILVMHEGKLVDEMANEDATQERILQSASGIRG